MAPITRPHASSLPKVRRFQIFQDCYARTDVAWIAGAEGFDTAYARMKRIAAEQPGRYFIFDVRRRVVQAEIDTAKGERYRSPGAVEQSRSDN